jgi:2-phosphosulfolactate phosphatase
MSNPWGQDGYGLRFDWGLAGAQQVAPERGVLVIVDVLSFTTSVTVATERGTAVYPAAWHGERATELAAAVGAELAVGRRAVSKDHPWTLSPAALASAPAPARLVLPSPNGSSIAASFDGIVVACALRNFTAVANWLHERAGTPDTPVTAIASGERWPDGSLRPALEDLLGAGAVLSALEAMGGHALSPEAEAAVDTFRGTTSVPDAVRCCASGLELSLGGFDADVEIAVQMDVSTSVPVLTDGAFVAS